MWIAVEGNIGVGKSTLVPKLAEYLGWEYLDERVEQDPEFQKHLQAYYQDNSHSIHLQTWLTNRRREDIASLDLKKNYIVERSIFGDIVFTKTNYKLGNIDQEHWEKYEEFAQKSLESIIQPKMIIYLHAVPSICFERTQRRNRECEEGVQLDYLEELHCNYTNVLLHWAEHRFGIPVFNVSYNAFKSVEEVWKECTLRMILKEN